MGLQDNIKADGEWPIAQSIRRIIHDSSGSESILADWFSNKTNTLLKKVLH